MRAHILIIAASILAALASCGSPLDVTTPRIDTRLTNAIKLREVSVNARIVGMNDSVTIDSWQYDVTGSSLSADTNAEPPPVSLDRTMRSRAADNARPVWLRELRIRIDAASSDGTVTLNGDAASGSGASARIVIGGVEHLIATGYNASAILHYSHDGRRSISGTILIGAERTSAFTLLIAINFTASQD